MHTTNRFAPAGCVADGAFVICGGSDGSVHHNSCEMYVPAPHTGTSTATDAGSSMGQWRMLPPMPTARAGCTACYVGGAVIVIGGDDGSGTPMPTVEALDLKRGKWVTLPSLNTPRTGAACCAVGNVIYVVGGNAGAPHASGGNTKAAATSSVEILDL